MKMELNRVGRVPQWLEFLGPGGVNLEKVCQTGQKQTGLVKVTQHPRGNFYLIPSHRSGGFMGNPQPRGLRQAPLVPSGFFYVGPG